MATTDASDGEPTHRRALAGAALLLLALAACSRLPTLAVWPDVGLDPSWQLGLHLCRERGLVVGRDVYYTYGPWGHLAVPLVLVRSQWLAAVAWQLVAHLALVAAVGGWAVRALPTRRWWLAPLPLLLLPQPVEYRLPMAALLAAAAAVGAARTRPALCALLGGAAAPALLVKTGPGVAAALAVVGVAAGAALAGRRREAVAVLAGLAAALAAMATAALGSPAAVAGWLETSAEVASAYTRVMERGGPGWQPLLVVAAVLALAVASWRDARRNPLAAPLLLGAGGLGAIAFRHGFLRHQTHFPVAFCVLAALAVWLAAALAGFGPRLGRWVRAVSAATLAASALAAVPGAGLPDPIGALAAASAELRAAWGALGDPAYRDRVRAELRDKLPLSAGVLAAVAGRSVDVLPREVALVEAWGLDWRPRPSLQSLVACTERLDRLDAGFLSGSGAPERLLVELYGVDTRQPLWDGPLTTRAIALGYRPAAWDGRWLALTRRSAPRAAVTRRLATLQPPLNQRFPLPSPERGHLELALRPEPSLLGRLAASVWKVPELRLEPLAPSREPARRIVCATAGNPFPVAAAGVEVPAELAHLLAAPSLEAPSSARVVCRGPWAWRRLEVEAWQVEWIEPPPGR